MRHVLFAFILTAFFAAAGCSSDSGSKNNNNNEGDGDVSEWQNEDEDVIETADESDGAEADAETEIELEEGQVCVPNTKSCHGNTVFTCNGNGSGYLVPVDCLASQFCLEGACVNQVCKPMTAVCDGMFAFKLCLDDGSGYDTPISCASDQYCSDGACKTRVCKPGAETCIGNTHAKCLDDGSGYETPVPCNNDQFCLGGACQNQVCQPSSWTCEGATAKKQCKPDGSGYADPVVCESNQNCSNGVCAAQVCKPKDKLCQNDSVITCKDDGSGYGSPVPCGDGKNCVNGECLSQMCQPDSKVCAGNSVATCLSSGDGYGVPVPCGEGKYCDAGTCKTQVCAPLAQACDQNGAVIVCNSNGSAWGTPSNCGSGKYCKDGLCFNQVCAPNEKTCDTVTSYKVCKADGSAYETSIPCGEKQVCKTNGTCEARTCEPQSITCQGNSIAICNGDGTGYLTPIPCGENKYCENGVCNAYVCAPNSKICDGNGVAVCKTNGSGYNATVACGAAQFCKDGVCTDAFCTPNKRECVSANTYRMCAADGSKWLDASDCGAGKFCQDPDGVCMNQVCQPNSYACADNTSYKQCNAAGSGYNNAVSCAANQYCNNGICSAAACTANERKCDGDYMYHICNAAGTAWNASVACGFNKYCEDPNGACKDTICAPNSQECVNASSYKLCNSKGSAWSDPILCSGNYICDLGSCKDPGSLPDPKIDVQFVRPQPEATVELTQGDTYKTLINAVMTGGTIEKVELLVDDAVYATDNSLPYEITFSIPAQATTGYTYKLQAKAYGNNQRNNVSKLAYIKIRNDKPVASFTATITGNKTIRVDAGSSTDRETATDDLLVRWDFENDGTFDSDWNAAKVATWTYPTSGTFTVRMQVKDAVGQIDETTHSVTFSDTSYVGGDITASTTWYGTVVITGSVNIKGTACVTVSEGTTVLFAWQDTVPADGVGDYNIVVSETGCLNVNGTAEKPVIFSSYGTGHTSAGAWGRIELGGTAKSTFTYATIEYGDRCVEIKNNSEISNSTVRTCKSWGVKITNSNGASLNSADIRNSSNIGAVVDASSINWTIANSKFHDNAKVGLAISGNSTGTITASQIYSNGTDGLTIDSSAPEISDALIRDNTRLGIYYTGTKGGTLTHSNVTGNGAEGIRIENNSTAPTINWNNIYGNSTIGGVRVYGDNPNLSYSGSTTYTKVTTSYFTAPNGGKIFRAKLYYSENDNSYNYITGGIENESGTSVYSVSSNFSNAWVSLSSPANKIRLWVYDNGRGYTTTISSDGVQYYVENQAGVELTAAVYGVTVDARYNYFGKWSNALDAVSMTSPTALNMQGFVGAAFNDTWSRGPYWAGSISSDTTWSGTIYITGDLTVDAGATLTMSPGTKVLFVKHDQDANGVGDFSIIGNGKIVATGTPSQLVEFNGEKGTTKSFENITLKGTDSAFDYVKILNGRQNLNVVGAKASISHAEITAGSERCVYFDTVAAGGSFNYGNVHDCSCDGVVVKGGTLSIGHLTSNGNTGDGLYVRNSYGNGANVTMTDSTLRFNTQNGISVIGSSTINFSYNHLGDNNIGAEIGGAVTGSLTYTNISYNKREGIFAYRSSNSMPSLVVNYNNIFSNSVTGGLVVGGENTSSTLNYSGSTTYSTVYTPFFTAPAGYSIYWVKTSYSENDNSYNYIQGGICDQNKTSIWTTSSNVSSQWVDISAYGVNKIAMWVFDNGRGYTTTITGSEVTYGKISDPQVVSVSLTVLNTTASPRLDVTKNWWGDLNVSQFVSEYPIGTTDYSNATGNQYTVGPRSK